MNDDTAYMRRALSLARRGLEQGTLPIGAVLACGGEVLGEAFWRQDDRGGLLGHAEHRVLVDADPTIAFGTRRDATLYTTLEPCLMCMGTAMSFFLGRIVYAMESPVDGASNVALAWAPSYGHPAGGGAYAIPQVESGLCRDEATELVRQWIAQGATGPEAAFARRLLEP